MTVTLNQKTNQALLALGNRQDARHIRKAIQEALGDVPVVTRDASGAVNGISGARTGSVCLLHYENGGGFIALPDSAEQIVGDVVLIPANTLKPGDKLKLVLNSEDAGTADAQARTTRVRIHTNVSVLSGVSLVTNQIAAANNTKFTVDKSISIVSNTVARSVGWGAPGGLISGAATSTAAIDCTVDQYIGLTVQNANTLVNHLIYYANLTLESVQ